MTKSHNYYLDLAFQKAEINLGNTGNNPSVGCIIVKNNAVLSSAVTSVNGRPHAEFNALKDLENCSGATLYTTLEPCSHYGKTPPCVNLIIKKKIKEVYYAFEDPDIRSFKKAKKIFKSKNIKSKLIPNKKNVRFYDSYFLNKKLSVSFVGAKIAVSKDYLTINKKNKWITNNYSRKIGHLIRNKYDCIISTSKSVNFDDSLLNCRIEGLNNNKPDLFIIDLNLKLKKRLSLRNLLKVRKTYIITSEQNKDKSLVYKKIGYKIILINKLKNKDDYNKLFKKIYRMGYARILFETGLTFLNFLLRNRMINELFIFKSSKKLGEIGKNNTSIKYLRKINPKLLTINLNGDKLFRKNF